MIWGSNPNDLIGQTQGHKTKGYEQTTVSKQCGICGKIWKNDCGLKIHKVRKKCLLGRKSTTMYKCPHWWDAGGASCWGGVAKARKGGVFIANLFKVTKELLGQKHSGTLNCLQEDIDQHLKPIYNDAERQQELGECKILIVSPPESEVLFDMTELQLKQVREVFCKARASSVPRPSSTAARVYKNCPKLVLQLWMILHVSGEGKISQKSGEWVTDYHCAQPGKCIWLHRTQASGAHTEQTSCPQQSRRPHHLLLQQLEDEGLFGVELHQAGTVWRWASS